MTPEQRWTIYEQQAAQGAIGRLDVGVVPSELTPRPGLDVTAPRHIPRQRHLPRGKRGNSSGRHVVRRMRRFQAHHHEPGARGRGHPLCRQMSHDITLISHHPLRHRTTGAMQPRII